MPTEPQDAMRLPNDDARPDMDTRPVSADRPAETFPKDDTAFAAPKYIKIRLYDPATFSSYQTKDLRLTEFANGMTPEDLIGVKASLGIWARTGAQTIQQLLFATADGWDDLTVQAWLGRHPQFAPPVATVAIDDAPIIQNTLVNLPCTLAVRPTARPYSQFGVQLIREGWGHNTRLGADGRQYRDFFTQDFLRAFAPMLEGSAVQAIKIHPRGDAVTQGALPPRAADAIHELQRHGHPATVTNVIYDQGLAGNTIAFLQQVAVNEKAVQDEDGQARDVVAAVMDIADTPDAEATRQLIEYAWTHGYKDSLGLSTNYRANASFGEIDGRPAFIFTLPTHHVSTELVPNPAAHGGLVSVLQSMNEQHEPQTTPVSAPPDVPTTPVATDRTVLEIAAIQAQQAELAAQMQASQALIQQQAQVLAEYQARDARAKVEAIVTQSTLDSDAQQSLIDAIRAGTLPTAQAVTVAVTALEQATQRTVAATQATFAASVPTFPGLAHIVGVKDESEVKAIRSALLWDIPLTQAQQEMRVKYGIERYHGINAEYRDLTRDYDLNFHFDQQAFERSIGAFAQSSSMTTNTYPEFLRNVLVGRAKANWTNTQKPYLKVVRRGEPFEDTRPQDEYLLGQMTDISEVAEDSAFTSIASPYKQAIRTVAVKFGNILTITEETILNDQTGLVKQTTDLLVQAMHRTLAKRIWKMQAGYVAAWNDEDLGDGIGDGTLYQAAARGNYVDGDVNTISKVSDLVNLMLSQTDIAPEGVTGEGIVFEPYLAVCDIRNAGKVRKILNGEYEITASNVANVLSLNIPADRVIGIHKQYMYGKDNGLYLYPDPSLYSAMDIQYFRDKDTPDLQYEGNQQGAYGTAFSSDILQLKLKWRIRLTRTRVKAFHCLAPAAE